jgi:hypothetical protein
MNILTLLLGAACASLLTALPATAQDTNEDAAFARAMADHGRGKWAQAWAVLAPLADAGHRQAAQQALRMAQREPVPGAQANPIGPARLARWQAVASGAPRESVPEPGPHGC